MLELMSAISSAFLWEAAIKDEIGGIIGLINSAIIGIDVAIRFGYDGAGFIGVCRAPFQNVLEYLKESRKVKRDSSGESSLENKIQN